MGAKLDAALKVAEIVLDNETVGKYLCGQYSDGSVRSIPDAIRGERENPIKKKKKKKKKGKKKKKNKNKKSGSDNSFRVYQF